MPYRRRSKLRKARRVLGAVLPALGVALLGFVALGALAATPLRYLVVAPGTLPAVATKEATGLPPQVRPVFRYSVVPGGVYSARELEAALQQNPAAAIHYAGFDVRKARLITTGAAKSYYVSYAYHGDVYWTSYRMLIGPSELLLTDGGSLARARCGNRLSETPKDPVRPTEPSLSAFDELTPAGLAESPALGDIADAEEPALTPGGTVGRAVALTSDAYPARGPFYMPIVVPPLPPATQHRPLRKPARKPRPPAVTPEPSSFVLMATALVFLCLAGINRSRSSQRQNAG
jgi:hypothetical protein